MCWSLEGTIVTAGPPSGLGATCGGRPMLVDRFGGEHSGSGQAAVAAYEEAVLGILAHRPCVGPALDRALALDPGLVAGHALKGLAAVVLARAELLDPAGAALAAARTALAARDGGTAGERALVAALADALAGRLRAAADRLARHLDRHPHDLLALKLGYAFRFMLGDAAGMLAATSAVLPAWTPAAAGYGFLLGCHAFALEECGELRAAEAVGREAVHYEPGDAWGLHAVAHVHEMAGRTGDGIAWLEASRPVWRRCNNFAFHMAWHLALFHLERGDHARVLELYDREVRPQPSDDFRDVANAVSLLWRLGQEGVAVGARWQELRAIAERRRHETTLVFASLHYLMALVAAGDQAAARELGTAIGARALTGMGDQAGVAAGIGLDLADAIAGPAHRSGARAALHRLVAATPQLGGSHAQRDLFVRTLALLAAEAGDRAAVARIMAWRGRLKREDRFAALVRAHLAAALARRGRAA
ncbi:tetratricopeptide repeat protein [Benzoatithermus flavus]|uniref:Tetratricopeptide repeat protein 38 n=1 Tax=Benzoatithermus flavus TaxID=3108223 RepID=A0ABU8XS14_9PROT